VERWDITNLPPSTEKRTPRAAGADSPRVPRQAGQIPRVLFSTPEARAVVIELSEGDAMGEHHVRERAIVQVVRGRVEISGSHESADCNAGTLVMFDCGEHHSVRALEDSLLLLTLAPWPAEQHYTDGSDAAAQHVPPNASVDPLPG
jgi:quercetin dioxygenase-like cupin family protein